MRVRTRKALAPRQADAGARGELTELGAIAVGSGPIADIAVDGTTLVVTNPRDDSVAVVHADGATAGARIPVGANPFAVDVFDGRAYVGTAATDFDSIAVIDTDSKSVIASHPLACGITGLAVDPDGKRVFVGIAGRDWAGVGVLDTTADEFAAIVLGGLTGTVVDVVRVSPDGRRVYAAASDACHSGLIVIDADAGRTIATVAIGSPVRDVAVNPDGSGVHVLTWHPALGGALHYLDARTNRIADAVALGGSPNQLILSPDDTRAYVVYRRQVAAICTVTDELIDTITVGARPSCVAASADGGRLYVADYSGVITAFSIAAAPTVVLPRFHAMAMEMLAVPESRECEVATP